MPTLKTVPDPLSRPRAFGSRATRAWLLLLAAVLLAPVLRAQPQVDPLLSINGVYATNNTAVPHLMKYGELRIELTGTPGAPFALLLSGDAYNGTPSVPPEPNILNGFFLKTWAPPTVLSRIHPVLDGIGTGYIGSHLPGYTPADFLPHAPAGAFKFDANGKFVVEGLVPPLVFLDDQDPAGFSGPTSPLVLALESVPPVMVTLYLQVVSLDVKTLGLRIGNGVSVVFDPLRFPGSVAYSEGQDPNPAVATLGSRQTLGDLADPDLADGQPTPLLPAPDFAGGGFLDHTDMWMITLAGPSELVKASAPPNGVSGLSPPNPDLFYPEIQGYYSGIEFQAGARPERNNENFEYPRISLPGNRELFHWRQANDTNPQLSEYGFGILFKDTGKFRNLTPPNTPGAPFTESGTRSPWEIEVGVTPDGNRAMVVLDQSILPNDKVFLLHLEPNGVFSNGLPIVEVTVNSALHARVFEESISFVKDQNDGWVAFYSSTNSTSTHPGLYPNLLWRVYMDGGAATQVLPATGLGVTRIHRTTHTNADHTALAVIAGSSHANLNVIAVTQVTSFGSHTILDATKFPTATTLMETNDASDGTTGYCHLSKDGSTFAFARQDGVRSIPMVAATNGMLAGTVTDLVTDLSAGGQFDYANDFSNCQDLFLTDDNRFLVFFQGLPQAGFINDRFDLFALDLQANQFRNLTRTLTGTAYAGETNALAYLGPWDLDSATALQDRPTIDPGGSFLAPDRAHRFFLRDLHGMPDPPRFNMIALAVAPQAGGGAPSFYLTNVFGNEFEPYFGAPLPATGAPNVITNAGFVSEPTPGNLRLRRIGGEGALADHYLLTARLSQPPAGAAGTEQLFLFHGTNPGPAMQLTSYSTASTPIAVKQATTISSVTPSQLEPRIAYVLNNGGDSTVAAQELIVQDLATLTTPIVVSAAGPAATFSRCITAGSVHWRPALPSGLVYVAGSVPRPAASGIGTTDGIGGKIDVTNPIDAAPYFFTLLDPFSESKLAPAAPGGNRRAAFIYDLR